MFDYAVMSRHVELAQSALAAELDQLHAMMEKDIEGADEHEQDAYFGNINDYWIDTAETIPLFQWSAQLLLAYGYFEHLLNKVCAAVRTEHSYSIAVKDLHGQGITRAKAYLSKVAGIPAVFSTAEWEAVTQVSEVRNVIAHRNGFVDYEPNNPRSTYCQLVGQQNLELKQELRDQPDARVVVDAKYVLAALGAFDKFTRSVFTALKDG
jgi:hypothetical protein